MLNINTAFGNNRLMRSVTGMSAAEFRQLSMDFGKELEKDKQSRYKKGLKNGDRQRKPGGGRKGNLKTLEQKLFFVLFYFKCYPTFDLLGLLFDFNRSDALRAIQRLTKILEKTLGRKMVLPKREIHSPEELFKLFPELNDALVDGTERPIQRPKNRSKQKKNYSGKKKAHTRKNLIITDEDKKVVYLSPTVEGKKHDYTIFKDEFPPGAIPEDVKLWTDLGFFGIEKDYPDLNVIMPKKKPKGKKLTGKEKANNKVISGFRVKVEHAIGGIKRLRITTDKFRNKTYKFNDTVMLIACGLWNYHLSF